MLHKQQAQCKAQAHFAFHSPSGSSCLTRGGSSSYTLPFKMALFIHSSVAIAQHCGQWQSGTCIRQGQPALASAIRGPWLKYELQILDSALNPCQAPKACFTHLEQS